MSRVRSGVMTACAPRSLAVCLHTIHFDSALRVRKLAIHRIRASARAVKLAAAQSDLPHSSRIELTGSARATERSILGFETGGRIAKLNVDVGERFSRGQVLAELDAQPDRLRVTQAQASLAAAEAGLMDRRTDRSTAPVARKRSHLPCCVREREGAASGRRGSSAHCQGGAWPGRTSTTWHDDRRSFRWCRGGKAGFGVHRHCCWCAGISGRRRAQWH